MFVVPLSGWSFFCVCLSACVCLFIFSSLWLVILLCVHVSVCLCLFVLSFVWLVVLLCVFMFACVCVCLFFPLILNFIVSGNGILGGSFPNILGAQAQQSLSVNPFTPELKKYILLTF